MPQDWSKYFNKERVESELKAVGGNCDPELPKGLDQKKLGASRSITMGFLESLTYGSLKEKIVCAQCGERGHVRTRRVQKKVGVSGGKATAAVFTGGLSMLATGLSRKQWVTEARCGNCESQWDF